MKIRNKILSGLLSAALITTAFAGTAFAEETTYDNGDYTATIHMYKSDSPANQSMCDPIFCHTADVTLSDDTAKVTFYVAYPIPAYPDQGTDGTLKDVVATYGDNTYDGTCDVTTKAEKTFDTTSALFGITAGDSLPTEAITLELPRAALSDFMGENSSNGIYLSVYVNAVMNCTQYFYIKASSLTMNENTTEQSMEISANVAKNAPTFTVTIPSAVTLGKISKTEDTVVSFNVKVETSNFDGDSVKVTTDETGSLTDDDENTLAFANSFGTQTFTETNTISGNITIKASDAAAAKAGNYTGTTKFVISSTTATSTTATTSTATGSAAE